MSPEQLLPETHQWGEYAQKPNDPFWIGIRSSLVGFVSIGPGYEPQFIGSGFIIATSEEGYLLALTAKHVVEEAAIQIQRPHNRRAPSAPRILFDPDLPLIGPMNLRAVWMGADRSDMFFVRHVSYAHNLDVALCVLEAQTPLATSVKKIVPTISLDTNLPQAGSLINIVSLSGFRFEGSSPKRDGKGAWVVSTRPVVRVGKVLSIETGSMGHNGPCFRTSIPVNAGMSGGFAYIPRNGSTVAACGIVSAGAEADDQQTDFCISGESLVVASLGTLALPLPCRQYGAGSLLYHALKDGEINDVAGGAKNLVLRWLGDNGACEIFRSEAAE